MEGGEQKGEGTADAGQKTVWTGNTRRGKRGGRGCK